MVPNSFLFFSLSFFLSFYLSSASRILMPADNQGSSTSNTSSGSRPAEANSPPMGTSSLPGFPSSPTAAAAYQQQSVHTRQSPSQYPSGQAQSQFLTGSGAPPHLPHRHWSWGSGSGSSGNGDSITSAAATELGGVSSGIPTGGSQEQQRQQQRGGNGGAGAGGSDWPGRSSRTGSFGSLNTQKRGSVGGMMNQRRQSWNEMKVGTDPAGHGVWRRWWDG